MPLKLRPTGLDRGKVLGRRPARTLRLLRRPSGRGTSWCRSVCGGSASHPVATIPERFRAVAVGRHRAGDLAIGVSERGLLRRFPPWRMRARSGGHERRTASITTRTP